MSNIIYGVVSGEWGKDIVLTAKDTDNNIQDLQNYTTITTYIRSPEGRTKLTCASTLVNTGTDGKYGFCFSSNNYPNESGEWKGTTYFQKTSELSKSYIFVLDISESV